MESGLLWFFLFLSLVIGWVLGFYSRQQKTSEESAYTPAPNTKHRLQLLFDTYSDDSIDRFIQSLEVTPDTLGIHISIGKHFRTQGEVEKAILIHQNLMARPELSDSVSEPVIYELAKDYKAAGLFDRAEALLEQLQDSRRFGFKSLKLLLDIYEHERDWQKALSKGLAAELKKHPDIAMRVAHYYCEIAEQKVRSNDPYKARQCLKKALSIQDNCSRAYLVLARMDLDHKEYRSTIGYLKKVAELAPENIVLILPMLLECTVATQSFDRHQAYLQALFDASGQIPVMLAIFDSLMAEGKTQQAHEFLERQVIAVPSITALDVILKPQESKTAVLSKNVLAVVTKVIEQVKKDQADYQCCQCGFAGEQLHWMCPSCKSWQTIQPVVEYKKA